MLGLSSAMAQIKDRKETSTNFKNHKLLAASVRKADKVTLYEGLPHQLFHSEVFEEELKTKQTVRLHNFAFYAEPLDLKETDAKKLTDLYSDPKSFRPFLGYKACGGFHPDYCIEWHVGKSIYRALICFGCHEMKSFGPEAELYCDIDDKAYKQLQETLIAYGRNRQDLKK